jgi:uncharacterized membrane protein YraQ (UPF0718 family)
MNTEKQKKLPGGIIFLALIIALYVLIALLDMALAHKAWIGFLSMLSRVVPMLGVVFVIMVVFNLFFTQKTLEKYLGSGTKGWLSAIIGGILVSGPPYVLFPLLSDLKEKGMSNTLIATFLYNRNVKIPYLPVMAYYFGLPFTIILSVYMILFSIVNGYIVGRLSEE